MTAADVGVFYLDLVFAAYRVYLDAANETQPMPHHLHLQHHVGAGVCAQDTGHGTPGAQSRCPRFRAWITFDEAAFLGGAASEEIFVVIGAFGAGWGAHYARVTYLPLRVSR